MPYHHRIKVRYGEVDMQQVVFNAHYLAYVDNTVDEWFRAVLGPSLEPYGWDIMLRRAVVEWSSPAGLGDTLDLHANIERWGNTSLDVRVDGSVDAREVFSALITYVGVKWATRTPTPAPPEVRAALDAPAE